MVKVYLSRKGVPFVERNVSSDEDARDQLLATGQRSTPLTVIGSELVSGYKPRDIDAALAAAGAV